jgi:N-acetylneuraminic acid mutarotase
MTWKLFFFLLLIFFSLLIFLACKKDQETNKLPVAIAGSDTTILLPQDSLILNGSQSYDPDGRIQAHSWRGIGNASFIPIINKQTEKPTIKNLTSGAYQFELTVTDNRMAWSKDTVTVVVIPSSNNRPPVADAGSDHTITLPTNSVALNGSASTDPDNNIIGYQWSKISGPLSFNITNPAASKTQVTSLSEGVYKFELKVTDAGGLYSYDTIQITVYPTVVIYPCTNRPVINVNLIPIGRLSEARVALNSGAAGGKILFAGGFVPFSHYSSRVDIYNIITNTWSTAELTIPERQGMAVASVGSKVLFAGGGDNDNGITTSRVDIYDAANNSWSISDLSKKREYMAATTLGNRVFFSGGGDWEPNLIGSTRVDIYNNSTNTWSIAFMGTGRMDHSATTIGNKIYFAGGTSGYYTSLNVLNSIDIYDGATDTWSTSTFQGEPRMRHASISAGNKIFWAGGNKDASLNRGFIFSDNIEIRDIPTGISTYVCISPKIFFNAVQANDKLIFFTGMDHPASPMDRIDVYNLTTNTWSIGVLPVNINYSTIISVNNSVFVAGGYVNGLVSNQVWKLEF